MTSAMRGSPGLGDGRHRSPAAAAISGMTESEQVAVQLLRRALGCAEASDGVAEMPVEALPAPAPGVAAEVLDDAIPRIRQALCRLGASQPSRLQLAALQDQHVTSDERDLLFALGAAQHADEGLLDGSLVRLAPARAPRQHLADAVRLLAEVLIVSGRLLASPAMLRWSLPAAALTVARLHGIEPGIDAIAWPART